MVFFSLSTKTDISHREASVESVVPTIVLAVAMVTVKVSLKEKGGK